MDKDEKKLLGGIAFYFVVLAITLAIFFGTVLY